MKARPSGEAPLKLPLKAANVRMLCALRHTAHTQCCIWHIGWMLETPYHEAEVDKSPSRSNSAGSSAALLAIVMVSWANSGPWTALPAQPIS